MRAQAFFEPEQGLCFLAWVTESAPVAVWPFLKFHMQMWRRTSLWQWLLSEVKLNQVCWKLSGKNLKPYFVFATDPPHCPIFLFSLEALSSGITSL